MEKFLFFLGVTAVSFLNCEAFYKKFKQEGIQEVRPKNNEELKKALCDTIGAGGICTDKTLRKIVLDQVFDLTNSEGEREEVGCYHNTKPDVCLKQGQKKLNVNNQCKGLTSTKIKYFTAGRRGLPVGSNKVIIGGRNGGLKGKGLRLDKSENVEIRNLKITDVNPHIIWGGDAIDMINVKNVLVDKCYIKNIGRQMIVTHYGPSTGVTIRNTVFDGRTPYSSYCDGTHYWLWLFLGQGDQITLQNNVIFNTSGRGPHLVANNNQKSLLHMIQNTFYDVNQLGLIDLDDKRSSLLLEGNVFNNVKEIVHKNTGNIFMPQNASDQKCCEAYLGRQCLLNTVVKSGGNKPQNSKTTLEDFKPFAKHLAKPIQMSKEITSLVKLPDEVRKLIK